MTDSLKQRIDFSESTIDNTETLKKMHAFNEFSGEKFIPLEQEQNADQEESDLESALNAALKPKRSFWRRLAFVAAGILSISAIAQMGQWAYDAWQSNSYSALGIVGAGSLFVAAGVGSLATEWIRIYRLRERAQERDHARELLHSHGIGQGRPFCEKLAKQSIVSQRHPAFQRWQSVVQENHNDKEVIQLYSEMVQPVLDEQARQAITRSAAESTVMIAVSPLALVDMAFIAWRNIRLINRIAAIYGIELGYYSRLQLLRLVLLNIAFAGASEIIREVGMDWLSQDVAARLSARAAQGIGAGILTARLGIKAMELCRPLPWLNDKPKLSDFRRQLVNQLKITLPKSDTKK